MPPDRYPSRPPHSPGWQAPTDPGHLPAPPSLPPSSPASGSDSAAFAPVDPGAQGRIGRYVVTEQLGRGGMGAVYRAHDPDLRRAVAIKLVLDPTRNVERFRREATACAKLRHPGIVGVHEVGLHGDRPYLVMDLVEGQSLEGLLAAGEVAPRRAAELVASVADALAHAHGHGVLHRDVKPENILIDRQGRPLLSDFGLARDLTDADAKQLTASGALVGTPAFMAPEQAVARRGPQSPATDVYGLGGVLYRALAGRPPFDGETLIELVQQVLLDEPVSPRTANPRVHRDLETICLRCLEKAPARRYQTAAALADDLRRFLQGEPIEARPATGAERFRRWVARHRFAAAALGLVAIFLVVLGVTVPAAVVRASRRERARIVAAARVEAVAALAAVAAFEEAAGADQTPAPGEEGEPVLVAAVEALEASGRWLALAPEEPDAIRGRFDAAIALGEVALRDAQWALARSAFDKALATGVDDAAARAALARVERARTGVAERHREIVEKIIADTRSGAVAARPGGYDDALFTLVGLREAQTVQLLAAALDEVADELHAATVELFSSAIEPTPEERASGQRSLEGLREMLDRRRTPGQDFTPEEERLFLEANRRVLFRRMRSPNPLAAPGEVTSTEIEADAQHRRVGGRELFLAKLCCDALGRLGIRETAVDALGRFAMVASDEAVAVPAGIALCLLGGETAQRHVIFILQNRFEPNGTFSSQIRRFVPRLDGGAPTGSPEAGAVADDAPGASGTAGGEFLELLRSAAEHRVLGHLDEALERLERAIALPVPPLDRAKAWTMRGNVLSVRGQLAGALAAYDEAIELAPLLAIAWSSRARIRLTQNDLAGGLADARKSVEIDPNHGHGWGHVGIALGRLGRSGDGAAALDRAIALDPEVSEWRSCRGLCRADEGDLIGARADHERAVELDPGNAEAWANLGDVLQRSGDLTGALAALDRALGLRPEAAELHFNRGNVQVARRSYAAAVADYSRAIELQPGASIFWGGRATAHVGLRDAAAARRDFAEALRLDPRNATALLGRGNLERALGRLDEAKKDYERAVEIAPNEANVWIALGVLHADTGDQRQAIECHGRALTINPQSLEALVNRGVALLRSGDAAGALTDFDAALGQNDTLAIVWFNRANARESLRDLEGALADLARTVQINPGFHHAFRQRAKIRARTGDRSGAIADLERVLEIVPDDAASRDALARLRGD